MKALWGTPMDYLMLPVLIPASLAIGVIFAAVWLLKSCRANLFRGEGKI